MMKFSRLAALVLATALTGCATPYAPPTSGPTAKLRIQMSADHYFVGLGTWTNVPCTQPLAGMGMIGSSHWVRDSYAEAERSKLDMLGGTNAVNPKRVERVVPAERAFALQLHALTGSSTCNQTIEFMPRAGGQYEVTHDLRAHQCVVGVSELVPAEGGFKRVPLENVVSHDCAKK